MERRPFGLALALILAATQLAAASAARGLLQNEGKVAQAVTGALGRLQPLSGVPKLNVSITQQDSDLNPSSSTDMIVKYLIGICIGALLMSIVFILAMAVPTLMKRAEDAPAVLVAYGGRAVRRGKRAVAAGKDAFQEGEAMRRGGAAVREGSRDAVHAVEAGGEAVAKGGKAVAGALAGLVHRRPSAEQGAAAAASVEALEALPAGEAASGPATLASNDDSALAPGGSLEVPENAAPSAHFEMVQPSGAAGAERLSYTAWTIWAAALYIAALVLLIVGTLDFVNNSVASFTMDRHNNSSALEAIKWLIVALIIITGVCDAIAAYVVMAAHDPRFHILSWSIRNWCYSKWVNKNAYRIHAVTAGLVMLVLSVACLLFGLGMIVVVIQLAVRLACNQLDDINIAGYDISDVCISIPASTGPLNDFCGSQALALCDEVTGMGVLSLVLGAAFLLWSHCIWLVVLLLSMWRFFKWRVVLKPAPSVNYDASGGLSTTPRTAVPTPAASQPLQLSPGSKAFAVDA